MNERSTSLLMTPNDVLEQLGYVRNDRHWISGDERLNDITFPLRRALEVNEEGEPQATVCGSYVFQTSRVSESGEPFLAPRPAVHVVQVNDEEQAKIVRKKLWNLGTAPFLILILPQRVLVYNSFNYQEPAPTKTKNRDPDLICQSPLSSEEITRELRDFHARAIDSGVVWKRRSSSLTPQKRVDQKLLKNLQELGDKLKIRFGLEAAIAHALIGKFIYLWYLRHRNILSNQWIEECHLPHWDQLTGPETQAADLAALVLKLEERFNGRIFPLDFTELGEKANAIVRFVAGIFRGDEAESGQLALDFQIYDFSCIPVELLSSIYEQFLKAEGRGKKEGAVYTREFVADYLLSEINSQKPLQHSMKVLDPACGSGVFLVLSYRRLIERRLHEVESETLPPQELSQILEESIFGVELILDACYVTEFSLILMLLSYVEPPELHANKEFHFPELHNRNIFQGDFFNSGLALFADDRKFDWIVGNPSWEKANAKEQPFAWEWMQQNQKPCPVGHYNLCEAFTWRVGEFLAPDGFVGLLTKATSLVNATSQTYRRAFFREHEVRRVTNFANLAYILFAGRADVPAASLIYRKAHAEEQKRRIVHYGPFAANQMLNVSGHQQRNQSTWSLTIYDEEVQWIESDVAESGEGVVWKRALWGNYRDEKALRGLDFLFPSSVSRAITERGWKLHQGLEIKNFEDLDEEQKEAVEYCSALDELDFLDVTTLESKLHLLVPESSLVRLPAEQRWVRKRGGIKGLEVAKSPHFYWGLISIAYSNQDFVLHNPQKAMSAPKADADYLRAISLYLNASVGRYLTFFNLIQWGIDRNQFSATETHSIPLPRLSPEQTAELCRVHQGLAALQSQEPSLFNGVIEKLSDAQIRQKLDEEVERILDVPNYLAVIARDFMAVRYQLNKGNSSSIASAPASLEDLALYADYLREILDGFGRGRVHHRIEISQDSDFTVCSVEITQEPQPIEPSVQEAQASLTDGDLWKSLGEQVSQWVYVQRSLRHFEGRKVHLWKTSRLLDWTRTQALIDSDSIIAEVLVSKEVSP